MITFYQDGSFQENLTYGLKGTPCEVMLHQQADFYLSGVQKRFPEDDFLAENNIESYMGTPLFNTQKEPQGVVGLMSRHPFRHNPEWAASLLKICGVRVSAELERMEFEDQLRARNRELEALRSIAFLLGGTLDLFEIIDIALTHLNDLVPYQSAGLALRYEDRLYFVNDQGFSPEFDWNTFERWVNEDAVLRETHTLTEPLFYADVQQEANWKAAPFLRSVRSLLIVPICSREQTRGLVYLMSGQVNEYTAHHAALGVAVMRQVATALENAQLYSDMENRVEERTNELQTQRDRTETILQNVADAIMFMDDEGHMLYVNAAWETLTGYSPDESLTMTFSDLYGQQSPPETSKTMW
ncbi:MAG: GAF domain-containing protein, partial [Anaerolineae bacterium]|nr:GAF domain-containing protein [Anaerolineae bacterium]